MPLQSLPVAHTSRFALVLAIVAYGSAMVLANLSISAFGPSMAAVNGFVLIGLDLALRDWLHVRVKAWQMLVLIASTGAITLALDPAAAHIAVASATAFAAAAATDWLVFASLKARQWVLRSNVSNVAGAAVDSLVFPALAFGGLKPEIVATMFVAKVCGGFVWSLLLARASSSGTGTARVDSAWQANA